MKSYSFLFWGYNVVWIGIAGYVAFLFIRLKRLHARVGRLEQRLGSGPRGSSA